MPPRDPPAGFRRAFDIVRPTREPRDDETARIADVRALAANHAALPPHEQRPFLTEVRRLSTAKERMLTTMHTPPDHPAFAALMGMLDGLIATDGGIATPHGYVTREELHESGAQTSVEDGRRLLQYPIAWPWLTKPDPDRGFAGVRGEPVYRAAADRGPHRSSFRMVPEADPATRRNPAASPWIHETEEEG